MSVNIYERRQRGFLYINGLLIVPNVNPSIDSTRRGYFKEMLVMYHVRSCWQEHEVVLASGPTPTSTSSYASPVSSSAQEKMLRWLNPFTEGKKLNVSKHRSQLVEGRHELGHVRTWPFLRKEHKMAVR